MEIEPAEVVKTVKGVFAKGGIVLDIGGQGSGSQVALMGTQQGAQLVAGGAMNSLAIGNAGGVAKSASVVGQGVSAKAKSAAAMTVKTGSFWTGSSKFGLGKWGLTLTNLAPLLLVGTLIAVGVGVYSFLQYRHVAEEGSLTDVGETPPAV